MHGIAHISNFENIISDSDPGVGPAEILFLHDSEGFTYQHPAQAAGSVPQCSITCRPGCEDELVRRLS